MKVAELIEKLNQLPQDLNVKGFVSYDNYDGFYEEISEVNINKDENGALYVDITAPSV